MPTTHESEQPPLTTSSTSSVLSPAPAPAPTPAPTSSRRLRKLLLKFTINRKNEWIAETKNQVKSKSSSKCIQQSTYTDQQSEPSMTDPVSQASSTTSFTILIDDEPGTTVMLDQLDTSTLDEFDDLSLRSLLLDFYSRHSIHHNNHIANAIHTSKNLTIRGHIFFVSTRQNAKKLNFAKITLPFDLRARRGQRSTENLGWGETFGTILLLFTHEHNEKTRALCLVRLELDMAPSVGSGIPCRNRQRQRLYATEASHLDCLAMELKSLHVENKFYYLYSELFKHSFLDSSKI
ncbi:hypothetical protein INT45_010709 [Circinella minor]|uniref:Uncharacterized protein n=1 Tax=Circinella minor TaxID=1195481 RepID=A0A8H7VF62_9FUNG|nr:hypothetical protein INT45_010709 [Circinella minor]